MKPVDGIIDVAMIEPYLIERHPENGQYDYTVEKGAKLLVVFNGVPRTLTVSTERGRQAERELALAQDRENRHSEAA